MPKVDLHAEVDPDEATAATVQRRPWHTRIRSALAPLLDIVVPPLCLSCHSPMASHDTLCPDCWRAIDFIRPPLCHRLGLPLGYDSGAGTLSARAIAEPPVYGRARAVARYDGVMRHLIHDLKFRDRPDARKLFGRWLTETGRELLGEAQVLVPTPLHRLKLVRRRFNQAALLAHEVSHLTGVPTAPLALVRSRNTSRQLGLTREQRHSNVKGAFAVPTGQRAVIAGRRVVLVDDVVTTGATISACARALLDSGAASVDVLALAMVTDTTATLLA